MRKGMALITTLVILSILFTLSLFVVNTVYGNVLILQDEGYKNVITNTNLIDSGNAVNALSNNSTIVIPQDAYGLVYKTQVTNCIAKEIDATTVHMKSLSVDTSPYTKVVASEYMLKIVYIPQNNNLAFSGLFATDMYDFMGSAKASYYDSDPSTIEPLPYILGSDGLVDVQKPNNVMGDPATVKSHQDIVLPPYVYAVPESAVDIDTTKQTLPTGIYHTGSIPSPLRVKGNVTIYTDGPITMTTPIIYETPDSKVTIYQNDFNDGVTSSKINFNGNIITGSYGDAKRCVIVTAYSGEVTFNGTASMGAVIYAPNATFKMNGTFNMDGSIITKSFDTKVNGSFKFTYDTELSKLQIPITTNDHRIFQVTNIMIR